MNIDEFEAPGSFEHSGGSESFSDESQDDVSNDSMDEDGPGMEDLANLGDTHRLRRMFLSLLTAGRRRRLERRLTRHLHTSTAVVVQLHLVIHQHRLP